MAYRDSVPHRYYHAIRDSKLTIYDPIDVGDPGLWIPTNELGRLLDQTLRGLSLAGLPPRTRSKYVKECICKALGYPIPKSFRKTKPRFPCQLFDVYVQKSSNLQIWNEELELTRRYVIVCVAKNDAVTAVKVVTGSDLMLLDTTGTRTRKYQARMISGADQIELAAGDTDVLRNVVQSRVIAGSDSSPLDHPRKGQIMPIDEIFDRLRSMVGLSFDYLGSDQERNRGGALHALVCQRLGYDDFRDDGQFPDLPHQLLEIKLQTSRTIDLGLVLPSSADALDMPMIDDIRIRICDVRYALFFAVKENDRVVLTHLVLTTGERFFDRFPLFKGNLLNTKMQIPLPVDFFG